MDDDRKSVEDVFRNFEGRRTGIIRALTTDYEEFYRKCDPEAKSLCLHGYPNEQWEVRLPADMIPANLPDPVPGINFARAGMPEKHWLDFVAVHSDTWLLSLAYCIGLEFDKAERQQLFTLINELPTILEVVRAHRRAKEKPNVSNSSGSKKPMSIEPESTSRSKITRRTEEEEVEDKLRENASCGRCGKKDAKDEFWIRCSSCRVWYHWMCVKMTADGTRNMINYCCPSCVLQRNVFS